MEKKSTLRGRIEDAIKSKRRLELGHLDLCKVYSAIRAARGPTDKTVEKLRIAVLDRQGHKFKVAEAKEALEIMFPEQFAKSANCF